VGDDRVPDAIRDEATGPWISKAEVAEVPFTAFRSRKKAERVDGRLVVRRIPDLNPSGWSSRRCSTPTGITRSSPPPTRRRWAPSRGQDPPRHAIIEQVHADLKKGPLAHLPSGVFTANSAWLVLAVIAFNLTRAAGLIADRGGRLAKATTATIRRTLITCRHDWHVPHAGSPCTCPRPGPGRPRSTGSSRARTHHHRPRPADHRRDRGTTEDKWTTGMRRPELTPARDASRPPITPSPPAEAHRWIEA
jgi:hypothetical protein